MPFLISRYLSEHAHVKANRGRPTSVWVKSRLNPDSTWISCQSSMWKGIYFGQLCQLLWRLFNLQRKTVGRHLYVCDQWFSYLTTVTAKLSCVLLPIMVSRRFEKTIFSVPNMVVALNCWVCHPTISKALLPTAVQLRQTILFLGMHSNWDYDTLNRNRVMRNSHDSLDQ